MRVHRNWDAWVDCLGDLCGAATGGVGIAVVVHDADRLLKAEHFPLFVSVRCQGADHANSVVDREGFSLDRPAIGEHFVLGGPQSRGLTVVDWVSGDDVPYVDDPALVDAAFERGERDLGSAVIGLAFNCSLS